MRMMFHVEHVSTLQPGQDPYGGGPVLVALDQGRENVL